MAQTKVKTKGITDTNVTNAKLGTDISAAKLTAGTVATARLGSGTASSSTVLETSPIELPGECRFTCIAMPFATPAAVPVVETTEWQDISDHVIH